MDRLENSTNPDTCSLWILHQQQKAPEAKGNLSLLLNSICVACKFVASSVRKAGLAGLLGMAGSANVQGEDQKKLDILANEVFINVLRKSGQCAVLVSEENDDPIFMDEANRGEYCVAFDPLDGSSNIDCGVSIGTIFGIWRVKQGSEGTLEDVLRPGKEMVAAGYCLYGLPFRQDRQGLGTPCLNCPDEKAILRNMNTAHAAKSTGSNCAMVLSIGEGCSVFTLDPSLGEFVLTEPAVKVPAKGSIYSCNEGNSALWSEAITKYTHECKYPSRGSPKSLRYVGSMVADVHRTLLYGGIFLYPADKKNKSGKLRLLYECFPMAYLMEQAGGLASTGSERILDLQPADIHERRPIFMGSPDDVNQLLQLIQQYS